MKKTLLCLLTVAASYVQLNAQCTIAPSCSLNGAVFCTTPTTNTNFPDATASTNYTTDIQITLGSGGGAITSGTINSLQGLPVGLSYLPNPTNGVLVPNSSACVLISGTPTTAGSYTVIANITASTLFGAQNVAVNWYLNVVTSTSIKAEVKPTEKLIVSPNPAITDMLITASFHFNKLQIVDALGKIVMDNSANYTDQAIIDVKGLNRGIYFIQASDGTKLVTKKFVKD